MAAETASDVSIRLAMALAMFGARCIPLLSRIGPPCATCCFTPKICSSLPFDQKFPKHHSFGSGKQMFGAKQQISLGGQCD
jgi:hypothetical protein